MLLVIEWDLSKMIRIARRTCNRLWVWVDSTYVASSMKKKAQRVRKKFVYESGFLYSFSNCNLRCCFTVQRARNLGNLCRSSDEILAICVDLLLHVLSLKGEKIRLVILFS